MYKMCTFFQPNTGETGGSMILARWASMTLLMSRPSKGYWTARNFLTIFMQNKFFTNIAKEII